MLCERREHTMLQAQRVVRVSARRGRSIDDETQNILVEMGCDIPNINRETQKSRVSPSPLHANFFLIGVEWGSGNPAILCFTLIRNNLSYPFLTSRSNSETSRLAIFASVCTATKRERER